MWVISLCVHLCIFVCVSVLIGTESMVHCGFIPTMLWCYNLSYGTHVCVFLLWDILLQFVLIAFLIFNIVLPYFDGIEQCELSHFACTFIMFVFVFPFDCHRNSGACGVIPNYAMVLEFGLWDPSVCIPMMGYVIAICFNCIFNFWYGFTIF